MIRETKVRGAFLIWRYGEPEDDDGLVDPEGRAWNREADTVLDPDAEGYSDAYSARQFTDDIKKLCRDVVGQDEEERGVLPNVRFIGDGGTTDGKANVSDGAHDKIEESTAGRAPLDMYRVTSSSGIMHSKFVIFDHLEFAADADVPREYPRRMDWVVAVTSANISGMANAENIIIFHGDESLFDILDRYWTNLREVDELEAGDAITDVSDKSVEVYTFPRHAAAAWLDDPIVNAIDFVRENMTAPPTIRVAMWGFTRAGPRRALVDLADEVRDRFGDDAARGIQILLNHDGLNFGEDGEGNNLEDAGIAVRVLPVNQEAGGGSAAAFGHKIHHKFMITDAEIEHGLEAGRAQSVWTGSYNWTHGANDENDELLIKVPGSYAYRKYNDEFAALWAMARPRP